MCEPTMMHADGENKDVDKVVLKETDNTNFEMINVHEQETLWRLVNISYLCLVSEYCTYFIETNSTFRIE